MTEPDRTPNQQAADAIIAIYRGDPTELKIEELLTPDVTARDWMIPDLDVSTSQAFIDVFWGKAHDAFPDATEEILATVFDGSSLVVHARFRGTFAAPFYGIEAHGGPLVWEIIDRWDLEDGKVVRVHFAHNTMDAHTQLKP